MSNTENTPAALPALTEIFEAYEVEDGETIYLTCDTEGRPCDAVPVEVLRHSTSRAKIFVPCPGGFMGLDDFGLAYRGAMRVA